MVSEDLIPYTKQRRSGYNSFQTADGLWFNTKARVPVSQTLRYEYANQIAIKIKELVVSESRKLQNDWYRGIPEYFNRRAFGMYFNKRGYSGNSRPRKFSRQSGRFRRRKRGSVPREMSGPFIGPANYLYNTRGKAIEKKYTEGRRQFPGRTRTGQLRRALTVTDISFSGCLLFVKPCYSSTGGKVDYVNILMSGAGPKSGHPYIPELDRRIKKNGVWRGISRTYWMRWQKYFQMKVMAANARLHKRISDMLVQMKVMEQRDIARAAKGSKKEKELTAIETERKSRKAKTGPVTPDSPYDKHRDEDGYGSVKRDPQVYANKYGTFNPFKPFQGPRSKKYQ